MYLALKRLLSPPYGDNFLEFLKIFMCKTDHIVVEFITHIWVIIYIYGLNISGTRNEVQCARKPLCYTKGELKLLPFCILTLLCKMGDVRYCEQVTYLKTDFPSTRVFR